MGSSSGIYRLLVAESEPLVGKVLKSALVQHGHYVELVQDGHEASRALRDGLFGVLILDMNLSGISPLELLRAARAEGRNAAVILTAEEPGEAAMQMCQEFERVVFFQKPFDLNKLRTLLDEVARPIKP